MCRERPPHIVMAGLVALSVMAVLVVGKPPAARTTDKRIRAIVDLCESPVGMNRKAGINTSKQTESAGEGRERDKDPCGSIS